MNVKATFVGMMVAGALMTSAPTAAAGPIIFREPIDDTFTTGYCGFPMEVHTTGTAVVHLFLDDDGAFERVIVTAPETQLTFTNLVNGKSVWTPSVNMVEEVANDDGTGTKTLRGLFWRLVVPGQGLVTIDTGRIDFLFTFDEDGNIVSEEVVFVAGPQEGQFVGMLCSILQ